MKSFEIELWKPVKGYEGIYEVSHRGVVRRITRKLLKRNGFYTTYNGKVMQTADNGKGYLRIKLCKNNKSKRTMLHRIIAEAFIANPNNYPFINHKNGIKTDNRIENLEWCTQAQNIKHAQETGLVNMEKFRKAMSENGKRTVLKICGWNSRAVINTENGEVFKSIQAAAREHNLCPKSLHSKLCGKTKNNTPFILR